MIPIEIALGGAKVLITAQDDVAAELVQWVFAAARPAAENGTTVAELAHVGADRFEVTDVDDAGPSNRPLDRAAAALALSGLVTEKLAERITEGVAFHAAAVERHGQVVLLAGASGAGKSTAALRLARSSFGLITDELAWVSPTNHVGGLLRPVGLKRPTDPDLMTALGFEPNSPAVLGTTFVHLLDGRSIAPERRASDNSGQLDPSGELAALVFPVYDPERPATTSYLTPAAAAERLLDARWVPAHRRIAAFEAIASIVRKVPAVEIVGASLDDVVEIVDALLASAPMENMSRRPVAEPTRMPRPSIESLDPLSALAVWYSSEKWATYRYTPEYHRLLRANRSEVRRVLQIGGPDRREHDAALQMWRDYFPQAVVVGLREEKGHGGLDIGERIELVAGSLADLSLIDDVAVKFGPFDIVIDHDSRDPADLVGTFDLLFPRVCDGGLYAVEGLQTTQLSQSIDAPMTTSVTEMVKSLLDDIHQGDRRAVDEQTRFGPHAESIHRVEVIRNLCMIVRGANRRRPTLIGRLDEPHVQHTLAALEDACGHLPNGRAEVGLAHVHESVGDDPGCLSWARAALEAGSTDPWAMEVVRLGRIEPSAPHG